MTEPTTGEQKTTDKTKLSEAVRIVQEAISAEENRLKQVADEKKAIPSCWREKPLRAMPCR